MHVLFIHPSFPAQFAPLAHFLATKFRWQCTFLTSIDTSKYQQHKPPFEILHYQVSPGELPKSFRGVSGPTAMLAHMDGVYQTLRAMPQLKPDLVVGHMSHGTMLLLRNLYRCPFVGYYDWLPAPFWLEQASFRPDFPPTEEDRLSSAMGHFFTYLHLHAVDAVFTPTHYQRGTAPLELQAKMRVIHDGVDTEYFQPRPVPRPTSFRGIVIGKDTRVVTYVAPGLESVRGFDIFMRVARLIARERDDVIFLIAGSEWTQYGFELAHLPPGMSFKQWVLSQGDHDPSRFHFLGMIPLPELVQLFNLTDLHCYLTVPFVLSWSLIQAMSSGCTILGSATPPIQEVVEHGKQALLADFYDVEGLASHALRVLKEPARFKHLGRAARTRVLERYEQDSCMMRIARFFQSVNYSTSDGKQDS